MKHNVIALTVTIPILLGSALSAETFSCSLKDNSKSGWLPEVLIFEVNGDSPKAKVYDPITFSTLNGFANAQVQAQNSVRTELKWTTGRYNNVSEVPSRDNPNAAPVEITYRATLLRGGNMIMLRAAPSGRQGQFNARGACKAVSGGISKVAPR